MKLFFHVLRLRPAIVHLQWFPIPFVDYFFVKMISVNTKLVCTVHNTEPFHGLKSVKTWVLFLGWRSVIKATSLIIVLTEGSKINNLMKKRFAADKIR